MVALCNFNIVWFFIAHTDVLKWFFMFMFVCENLQQKMISDM